jgi:ferric-dicitrate binding protein FerR (iron transport regulator)
MSISAELDTLLNRLVDEQLDDSGLARLQNVLRGDAGARRRYRQVMALHAGLQWDYVAAARNQPVVPPRSAPGFRWWILAGALAATLMFSALLPGVWSILRGNDAVVMVAAVSDGDLTWSSDDTPHRLAVGDRMSAGWYYLKGEGAMASLQFKDGTTLTLIGDALLNVSEANGKRLHLERGLLAADVRPQPAGKPLVIQTATAELQVIGTRFTVNADDAKTSLDVDHGRVRLERLADGQSVEVGEREQVSATLDASRALTASLRPQAPTTWKYEFSQRPPSHWSGTWLAPTSDTPGALRGEAYLAGRTDEGKPVIHYGLRIQAERPDLHEFVRLTADSRLTMRFRIPHGKAEGPLRVMLCAHVTGGAFAGTFWATIDPLVHPADAAGWRTVSVPTASFVSLRPEVHKTLVDRTLSLILPNTIQRNVGLEIASLAIESP